MTRDYYPRRSCREGRELELNQPETEQEPSLMATYPIGLSSTIDPNPSGLSYTTGFKA
jgi:hypothetical protein